MRWCWLTVLCGCRSILGIDGAALPGDAGIDTIDAALTCIDSKLLKICFTPSPMDLTVGSETVISTDTDANCTAVIPQIALPSVCIMSGDNVTIEQGVLFRVSGTRPLVIHAARQLLVSGNLDVASRRDGGLGAGAVLNCASQSGISSGSPTGAGGAAGGSFGAIGGSGGTAMGGGGGVANPALGSLPGVRGGCAGGRGGTALSSGGLPGAGGGAVYLAGGSIVVSGTINASGAGGGVAATSSGGGGGGSGGLIVIDTSTFAMTPSGQIFALGGGGAGGASAAAAGPPGTEATGPAMPAPGTFGAAGGGAGGSAALPEGRPGGNAAMQDGAGGGGGGVGFVFLRAPATSSQIAPTPTML